ncbi:tail fiber domain-containing protein [Burkholderia ambifaria]|uniref:tail fiber domain-containing protein n=1 Tax=Burkholderia ambifaria TaxID=152480 RepID=UPI001C9329E4|nr:tail fiber domain-containing protein [Burkholderia ambifaria]MBY4771767.1 tail fiber domain-containing protein [Burkholderia ambifaria]
MSIIGNFPNTLSNGTTADATQVMADLNYIATQVNANAQPLLSTSPSFSGLTVSGVSMTLGSGQNTEIDLVVTNANTTVQYFLNPVGLQGVYDIGRTLVRWSSDTSGNFNVAGNFTSVGTISGSNVTGTSDERLKKDWAPFGSDFLEHVATVLHGTYTRIDTGERRVGVGAQSLREVIPEAVFGDETLTVSEGSAALAIVVELTREVLRLRALLEPVK